MNQKDTFCSEPAPLIASIENYLKNGSVLDVGAGQGRNALYLARHGFNVTAVDISETANATLQKSAEAEKLAIETIHADIRTFEPKNTYDVVLGFFILHFFKTDEAQKLIKRMQVWVKPGGLQVIAAITNDGDFYRSDPETDKFYPKPGELKKLYSGWKMLVWEENTRGALQKTSTGETMFNLTSFLLAQKPAHNE